MWGESDEDEAFLGLLPEQRPVITGDYNLPIKGLERDIVLDQNGAVGTGGVAWEAATYLCQYLMNSNQKYNSIIELGSGTGLVGMVASLLNDCPAVLTDLEDIVDRMSGYLQANLKPSEIERIKTCPLIWGQPLPRMIENTRFDLVIASECIYHPDAFEPLIQTLLDLSGPETTVLIAYKVRRKGDKVFWKHFRKLFHVTLLETHKPGIFLYEAKRIIRS